MKAGTQFIGIKPNVDMTERRSNVANNSTEVFTIEDISKAVVPYGVYTALLTQKGESNPQNISRGSVEAGFYYTVKINKLGINTELLYDFSNVGGPIYPDIFDFVATSSDVPNDYGNASLSFDTGAPVAKVLENTIGNVWFTYNDVGSYYMKSNGLFTGVFPIIINNIDLFDVGSSISQTLQVIDSETILIRTSDVSELSDDFLVDTPIEIRVYG
jgi:hypothetical protein